MEFFLGDIIGDEGDVLLKAAHLHEGFDKDRVHDDDLIGFLIGGANVGFEDFEAQRGQFDRPVEGGRQKMDVDHVDVMGVHLHAEARIHRVDVVDLGEALLLVLIDAEEVLLLLDEGDLLHIGAADALAGDARRGGEHPNADDVFVIHRQKYSKDELREKENPGLPGMFSSGALTLSRKEV